MDIDSFKIKIWPQIYQQSQHYLNVSDSRKNEILYSLTNPGKLLRPYIFWKYTNEYSEETRVKICLLLELLHTGSLCHDDIIDFDTLRRRKLSHWNKFSVKSAIEIGDLYFLTSYKIIEDLNVNDKLKLDFYKVVNKHVRTLISSQINEGAEDYLTRNKYYDYVDGKTGAIFSLCFDLIKVLTGKNYNPGISIGRYYQIIDDLRDLTGNKNSRFQGLDIISRKPTIYKSILRESFDFKNKLETYIELKDSDLLNSIISNFNIIPLVNNELSIYEKRLSNNKELSFITTLYPELEHLCIGSK